MFSFITSKTRTSLAILCCGVPDKPHSRKNERIEAALTEPCCVGEVGGDVLAVAVLGEQLGEVFFCKRSCTAIIHCAKYQSGDLLAVKERLLLIDDGDDPLAGSCRARIDIGLDCDCYCGVVAVALLGELIKYLSFKHGFAIIPSTDLHCTMGDFNLF